MVIFCVVKSSENSVKWTFCRTHYRTRKWGFRRENNRYALPGFRLPVLKCKIRPLMTWKHTTIVQYYGIFFINLLHLICCNSSSLLYCVFVTQTLVFLPKTKMVRLCPPLEYSQKFLLIIQNNNRINLHFSQ